MACGPLQQLVPRRRSSGCRAETTTIELDDGFAATLAGLGVVTSGLARGKVTPDRWAFPIVSGTVARKKNGVGMIRHAGGLRCTDAEGVQVDFDRLRIDDSLKPAALTARFNGRGR